MSKIYIAQDVVELRFILSKRKDASEVLPLDLSSQLYCINNKINYIDPNTLVDKNFHEYSISKTDNIVNKLNIDLLKHESIKIFYKRFIRFEINSVIFLYEILKNLKKKIKIDKIIISGWSGKKKSDPSNYYNNYNVSRILSNISLNIPIEKLTESSSLDNENSYEYYCDEKIDTKKKYILLSNLGYNFFRIILWAFKNNFKILLLIFDNLKLNFIKKIILKFLGVKFVFVKKRKKDKTNYLEFNPSNLENETIKFKEIINARNKEINLMVQNLLNQCDFVENFISKNLVSLVVSNVSIGIWGYLTEFAKKKDIPSINISHGTIAKSFNSADKIYKKNIADAVFSGVSTYYSIQSKITEDSLETHKLNGTPIKTSNLIFSEVKIDQQKNKYILYAVTSKTFNNIQFLGVEMYYEFIKNLEFLDNLRKKNNLKFIIKLHPDIYDCYENLKKMFPNLLFSKKKINTELKKSFLTISYSSTVIEDSLHCGVPVILFDPRKRYKHCNSCTDPSKKNNALYYLTNEFDLLTAIKSIKESESYNFNDYIYEKNSKENINKSFRKILNIK